MAYNQDKEKRPRRVFSIGKIEMAMLSSAEKKELKERISKSIEQIKGNNTTVDLR